MYRRRSNRFRPTRTTKPAILESTGVQAGRKSKCAGCGSAINVGETFLRLRLRLRFAVACATCSHVPKRAKRYHTACRPTDVNAAMGYDPSKHAAPPPFGHVPQRPSGAVPPPPKPPTPEEVTLVAIAQLEAALVAQLRGRQKAMTPALEKEFKTFQGIKARALRPGTPGEEQNAMSLSLQRLIKMVFA
jgi:hypothetical protein